MPAHQDPLFSSWRLYQWARNLAGQRAGRALRRQHLRPRPATCCSSRTRFRCWRVPAAPFLWLGVPVVVVYAALVWLSFLGCRPGDVRLRARTLTGSRFGAFVAAVIFTAAPVPHRARDAPRAAVDGVHAAGRARHGAAAARRGRGARGSPARRWPPSSCRCIYYGVFMITVWPLRGRRRVAADAAAAAASGWSRGGRVAARRGGGRRRLRAAVPARPGRRRRSARTSRSSSYSATLESYLVVPAVQPAAGAGPRRPTTPSAGSSPGVVASALAVSALLTPDRAVDAGARPSAPWWRWTRRSAATAGPIRCCGGSCRPTAGLRVPARFGAIVLLCVALLAAIGARQPGAPLGRAVAASVAAGRWRCWCSSASSTPACITVRRCRGGRRRSTTGWRRCRRR